MTDTFDRTQLDGKDRGQLSEIAAALGPAYVRVSGTWANTMYFADAEPTPSSPPTAY